MNVQLARQVADIYIPPVDVLDDREAMNQMLAAHCEQKQFFADIIAGDITHDDLLEVVEAYEGTRNMDSYIARTERQLDQLILSGY